MRCSDTAHLSQGETPPHPEPVALCPAWAYCHSMTNAKTKVQRIAFTPTEELRALLLELSGITGKSMSAIAREWLEEIRPVMQDTLETFRKLEQAPDRAREIVLERAVQAQRQIGQAVIDFDVTDARTMAGREQKQGSSVTGKGVPNG